MKKNLGILGISLGLFLGTTPAKAVVTYTIFTENWEDNAWTGFSVYPGASTGVVTTGDTIYGAPATGAAGTWMPESIPGSLKNGKTWPLYWAPNGNVGGNVYYENQNLGASLLRGAPVTFTFDSYISSYDAPQTGTALLAFVKFFNADFSYYYDWAGSSVINNLNSTPRDSWVSNTITTVIPIDAAIMQVGFSVNQSAYSNGSLNVDNMVVTVPEPSSAALMGVGVAGLLAFRLRRKV
ncbi:MAG: PEP-CTERM sorting domain-containing protein [Verrucomicrobia bacterium]|nr:PEP-CTERM sorting domain-containing protein [Verrucomicrobiota bacterium]